MTNFVLVGVHIKPDTAVTEINHLEEVFTDAATRFRTRDIVIMGDLNADCSYVRKSDWKNIPMKADPAVHWLITDDIDTTVSATDCAYDR